MFLNKQTVNNQDLVSPKAIQRHCIGDTVSGGGSIGQQGQGIMTVYGGFDSYRL